MRKSVGPFRRVFRRVNGSYRSVLESMAPASIGKRAVKYAIQDIGLNEYPAGSNSTKYGQHWKQDGVPWCGMAVAYWWQRAGYRMSRELALQIDYVPTVISLARAKKHGLFIVGRNRVRAGDAVCFDFPGGASSDHVGLFERWLNKKAGTFTAIEGNTSATGHQSNGGAVLRKTRSMNQVAAFVRKVK